MTKTFIEKLERQASHQFALDQIIALGLLAGMVICEHQIQTTVSPLISMVGLIFFAQRMQPPFIALWGLVYSACAFFFLANSHMDDLLTVYIRFGTLLMGGLGAFLISMEKSRMKERSIQTIHILEKLPMPVIVSDGEGFVLFMNEHALKLLELEPDQVCGASYFMFMAGNQKGQTIQKYLEFVDSGKEVMHDVILQLKSPRLKVRATVAAIEGPTKLLATVFWPDPARPPATETIASI